MELLPIQLSFSHEWPVMNGRRAVAASIAIFLAGIAISAVSYFSRRPLRFSDAVISNFLSPDDNPGGYLAASLGTVIAALVLALSAPLFYKRMSKIHKAASIAAAVLYGSGLLAATLIGCLAGVSGLDFSVHLMLAYAAFISLQAGISIYLTLATYGPRKSNRLRGFAATEWAAPLLLIALSFGPNWPSSTAFCEWGLCTTIATGLWVLANSCS